MPPFQICYTPTPRVSSFDKAQSTTQVDARFVQRTSLAGLMPREANDCKIQLRAMLRPVLSAMTVVAHNQSESHSSESPLPDDEESRAFLNLARPAPIMSLGAIIPPAAAAAHHAATDSPRQFNTALPCAHRLRRAQGRMMKKDKQTMQTPQIIQLREPRPTHAISVAPAQHTYNVKGRHKDTSAGDNSETRTWNRGPFLDGRLFRHFLELPELFFERRL